MRHKRNENGLVVQRHSTNDVKEKFQKVSRRYIFPVGLFLFSELTLTTVAESVNN